MAVNPVATYTPQSVNLDPITQIALPVSAWMLTYTAADVPKDSVPWMLAQGWQIVSTDLDNSTTPPTPYYNMARSGMATSAMLQSLVNVYTLAYNEGRTKNALRYDNIVANWTTQIGQCITELDNMVGDSNAYVSLYLGQLGSLMSQIDGQIAAATSQAAGIIGLAGNLGSGELIRINEQFDNLNATNAQQLASRGFYSSAILTQATARVERERNLAILELNDRINREKIEIQKFQVQTQHELIGRQLEANMQRLAGLTETHRQEMDLYKYMIDTTNGIIIGLFGFQERRTDAYPSLEVMSQICSQLGDASSTSWVSP
jgi:hypothetical protein